MNLEEIRNDIDRVDREIVKLYEERMKLCSDVADFKITTGKKVLDKEREREKIEKVTKLASGDFNKHGVNELFSQIMAMSRKLQYSKLVENHAAPDIEFEEIEEIDKNARVVYQGERGAYAYEAAYHFFGSEENMYHVSSWREAMEDIKSGKADFGVFPIDNSTAGIVSEVHDLLMKYENYIVAETYVKVDHVLLGVKGAKLSDIKTIYSHPQALMQCEDYLNSHEEWTKLSYTNTASSALKVARDEDKSVGAVASRITADIYGLDILAENIISSENNTTRFIIVSSKRQYVKNASKISMCFEIQHESGSLYNILSHLIYNGINMTKIESRPIPEKTWEYRFFVDIEGNLLEPAVYNALTGIAEEAKFFKILGSYR